MWWCNNHNTFSYCNRGTWYPEPIITWRRKDILYTMNTFWIKIWKLCRLIKMLRKSRNLVCKKSEESRNLRISESSIVARYFWRSTQASNTPAEHTLIFAKCHLRQEMYFLMWYLPRHTSWSDASDVPTVSWASSPIFAMHTERSKAARVFSLIRPSLDHRAKQAIIALIEQARADREQFELLWNPIPQSCPVWSGDTQRRLLQQTLSWSDFVGL